jgi:hypothetical protein
VVRPSAARTFVGLLTEDAWAIGTALGSLLAGIGLAVRWLARRSPPRLGGAVVASVGAVLLALFATLTLASRHFRMSSDPAVVIATEAHLLDEKGVPLQQKDGVPEHVVVPEGAGVHVLDRRGTLARIEWGDSEGWVGLAQLRVLPER